MNIEKGLIRTCYVISMIILFIGIVALFSILMGEFPREDSNTAFMTMIGFSALIWVTIMGGYYTLRWIIREFKGKEEKEDTEL